MTQPTDGIFCNHGPRHLQVCDSGSLNHARLAVKDLFQLEGYGNAAGNPDWFASHQPATGTSAALQLLLDAGATFSGFTLTDELAYSLQGDNSHYGSADNPHLPGHFSGGSSSGSAVAVAAGMADIGLGTDTGGSIRVPASYCGLLGLRPTHNAVSTEGLIGLAPSFDTVGWFCRDAQLMASVGELLLPKRAATSLPPTTLVVCPEIMALGSEPWQQSMAPQMGLLQRHIPGAINTSGPVADLLPQLADCFRILQGREIILQHGDWLEACSPRLTAPVAERLQLARAISDAEVAAARELQGQWREALLQLLPNDQHLLLLPTTPTAAPARGHDAANSTLIRQRTLSLTAIGGLVGCPQIHIPAFSVLEEGIRKPSGYSLLMRPGNDHALLQLATQLLTQPISPAQRAEDFSHE